MRDTETTAVAPEGADDFVTKLLALSAELTDAKASIVKLEKDLKAANDMKGSLNTQATEAKAEIEQVHLLLDVLPGAPGRKGSGADEWSRPNNNAMTRLAGYLAART